MKHALHLYERRLPHHLSAVVLCLAILILLCLAYPSGSRAQSANEQTFSSPGDAALALYVAARSDDSGSLNAIFGSNADKVLHTGDEVADKNLLSKFASHYEQMHRVVIEPDQTATLYIGADNWPMPISLVKNTSGAWYFDTEAGIQEILYRRIGNNENGAIQVLETLIDAQKEYASTTHDDEKVKQYASKVFSTEGKHDGLYWKTADNEPPSPIGPLLADASYEGYTRRGGRAVPWLHLSPSYPPGTGRGGRRARLQREWCYDPRGRVCGLSRGVPHVGRDDLHHQPGWQGV